MKAEPWHLAIVNLFNSSRTHEGDWNPERGWLVSNANGVERMSNDRDASPQSTINSAFMGHSFGEYGALDIEEENCAG